MQAARSRVETSDSDSDSNHSVCSPMHTPPILTNFVDLRDETDDIAEWPQLNAVRNESELQGD